MSNTLHILSKSPSDQSFGLCMEIACSGDCILLIQDAVYGLQQAELQLQTVSNKGVLISALGEDINARGVNLDFGKASTISYPEFVDLTTSYQRSVSW